MDLSAKLTLLGSAAAYDVCSSCGWGEQNPSWRSQPAANPRYVHISHLPDGKCVRLFKVLMTNACANDCAYCVNQVGRDVPRSRFEPEELARLFWEYHQRRWADGLFLTSGIPDGPSQSMEPMLKAVEILRRRYQFNGYIHLKILPGAKFEYVQAASHLADRVSVNMEAPTPEHLARLSSGKDLMAGILERMRWVKKLAAPGILPAGQTTQFVVGAAGETDRDLFQATQRLYTEVGLRRVYFSAFQPISGSWLENRQPTPPMREHRLYQMDWLTRFYRFSPQELGLAFDATANLPLAFDPKLVIAVKRPELFPVDVNTASYEQLTRVPGIGLIGARKICEARREHSLYSLEQLSRMRIAARRAAPFIYFGGHPPPSSEAVPPPTPDELESPLSTGQGKGRRRSRPANAMQLSLDMLSGSDYELSAKEV